MHSRIANILFLDANGGVGLLLDASVINCNGDLQNLSALVSSE